MAPDATGLAGRPIAANSANMKPKITAMLIRRRRLVARPSTLRVAAWRRPIKVQPTPPKIVSVLHNVPDQCAPVVCRSASDPP